MKKNKKSIPTNPPKEESNVIFHMDSLEVTMKNKPYIIPASKSGSYSKLEKAEKREEKRLKKELKDYTKYDV
ncbi:MAG: hypothetical protein K2L98_03160 [Bacilli bacterium]|nr:hypothetical protein [Bacilli bacterium]